MQTNETKKAGASSFLGRMVRKQVMIPLAALLLLFLFNLIVDPSFFKIELGYNSAGNPVLSGFLITILDSGSELAILAIGMTLVTAATGGQDISVGATTAIAGSVLLRVLCGTNSRPETLQAPIIVAFLVACVVAMLFGAFNGVLVAVFKIQPMIATLILYTAGRSIAAWINNNELPVVSDETLTYFGEFIPGIPIPTPFFIAVACMIVIGLVLKFTNLRLYTQAVGINENSSKLNGLNPVFIKILSFVILGLCVGVAALIKVSRSAINYSTIANNWERKNSSPSCTCKAALSFKVTAGSSPGEQVCRSINTTSAFLSFAVRYISSNIRASTKSSASTKPIYSPVATSNPRLRLSPACKFFSL